MTEPMQIEEFIRNKWSAYADYDNRRSLPHIIDGLKITQRKVMYTATRLPNDTKPVKVSQFAAKAAEMTAYHHGEASMIDTVVGMAQDYPGSNNYPYMEKHGQFGSRLSTTAAAPRYIHTKIHKNWERFFKPVDQQILDYNIEDNEKIEPKYYIPIIPTILLNGADGTGNGYRSSILNYDVPEIVKALKEIIKYGMIKTPLLPKIVGWKGAVTKIDRQVIYKGVLKIVNTTKLHISELPPGYDNEAYKKLLNKLVDIKFIKDYANHSTEDRWDWHIECARDTSALGYDVLLEKLGLISKISENFVCWGIDSNAPMTFASPESLIEFWFKERVKLYDASIKNQIGMSKNKVLKLNLRVKFIEWCLNHDFRTLTKAEFITQSVSAVKTLTVDIASDFVAIPMYKITKDEVEKMRNEIEEELDNLDELEKLNALGMMEVDLKNV